MRGRVAAARPRNILQPPVKPRNIGGYCWILPDIAGSIQRTDMRGQARNAKEEFKETGRAADPSCLACPGLWGPGYARAGRGRLAMGTTKATFRTAGSVILDWVEESRCSPTRY